MAMKKKTAKKKIVNARPKITETSSGVTRVEWTSKRVARLHKLFKTNKKHENYIARITRQLNGSAKNQVSVDSVYKKLARIGCIHPNWAHKVG